MSSKQIKTDNMTSTETYQAAIRCTADAIAAVDAQVDHLISARNDLAATPPPAANELVAFQGKATINDGEHILALREALKAVNAKLKTIAPRSERKSRVTRDGFAYKLVNKTDGSDCYAPDSGLGWFANKGQKTLRSPKYADLDLKNVQMIEVASGKIVRDGSEFTVMGAPGSRKA